MKIAEQLEQKSQELEKLKNELLWALPFEHTLEALDTDLSRVHFYGTFIHQKAQSLKELGKFLKAVPAVGNKDDKCESPYAMYIDNSSAVHLGHSVRTLQIRYNITEIFEGRRTPNTAWITLPFSKIEEYLNSKQLISNSNRKIDTSEYHYYSSTINKSVKNITIPIIKFQTDNIGYVGGAMRLVNSLRIQEIIDYIKNQD